VVTIHAATSVSATFNTPLGSGNNCNGTDDGTFNGNITVSPGQSCTFISPSLAPAQITGNVAVNGGSFALHGGAANRNLSVTGASSVTLDQVATIGGKLAIQQVGSGQSPSMICGAQVKGNMSADNNASPLAIGTNNTASCPAAILRP
jgi:hypothetical protein